MKYKLDLTKKQNLLSTEGEEWYQSLNAYKKAQIKIIRHAILNFRKIIDRCVFLHERSIGTDIKPMGSGGVGQVRIINGKIHIQIGYGKGQWNYAMCAII